MIKRSDLSYLKYHTNNSVHSLAKRLLHFISFEYIVHTLIGISIETVSISGFEGKLVEYKFDYMLPYPIR